MQLTLAQCCSTATALVQHRTDIPLSEASFYANIALQEVRYQLKTLASETLAVSSTTSGENRVALPGDFAYPINLSNTSLDPGDSRRVLVDTEAAMFDSRSTALGVPERYALFSTWIELWPSPDSAYSLQLRYAATPTTLTASTATPTLQERYHLAWCYKTAELLAASRNDLENEAVCRARYLSAMGDKPTDEAFKQRDKLSQRVQFLRKMPS